MRPIVIALFMLLSLWVAPALSVSSSGVTVAPGEMELTLYGQDDLTLVRDRRQVPLKQGVNRLGFRWLGQLIDPTSIQVRAAEGVSLRSVVFPADVQGRVVIDVEAAKSGTYLLDLLYLTAGLSWQARYQATMNAEQTAMRLDGLVDIVNNAQQPLTKARIRLLIGRIQLLDRIADLARQQPYGGRNPTPLPERRSRKAALAAPVMADMAQEAVSMMAAAPATVSARSGGEVSLLEIDGRHDLPASAVMTLPWLAVSKVGVGFVYRFDRPRYGDRPMGLLSFDNTEAQGLGRSVLPQGRIDLVRRDTEEIQPLAVSRLPYVPLGETARIELPAEAKIRVEPRMMKMATDDFVWQRDRLVGWKEQQSWQVDVYNHGALPVTIEIRRELGQANWTIENQGAYGGYTQVDADTVQYELNLPPESKKQFEYRVTLPRGKQQ